jgi:hypothetical protein
MPRKLLTVLMFATGGAAGAAAYQRRTARRIERVEFYAEDGSMATLEAESPAAIRLLALARDLIVPAA